jgi:hypothetical protein
MRYVRVALHKRFLVIAVEDERETGQVLFRKVPCLRAFRTAPPAGAEHGVLLLGRSPPPLPIQAPGIHGSSGRGSSMAGSSAHSVGSDLGSIGVRSKNLDDSGRYGYWQSMGRSRPAAPRR